MRRVRVVLLLLGLALAVPVMLLVARAREGERLEREMRYQVVAARAFDEMERELTAVLEREEARPFEAYRTLVDGERGVVGDVPPFVIGYFQIDPDGSLHARAGTEVGPLAREALANGFDGPRRGAPPATTLLRSGQDRVAEAGKAKESPRPSEDAYDVISRLNRGQAGRAERKQQVRQEPISKLYGDRAEAAYEQQVEAFARKRAAAPRPAAPPQDSLVPRRERAYDEGTTLAEEAGEVLALEAETEAAPTSGAEPSAGMLRADPSEARSLPTADTDADEFRADLADERVAAAGVRSSTALVEHPEADLAEARSHSGLDDSSPEAQVERRLAARPPATERDASGSVRVALDPMVGLPVAANRLLLYRTALVDELGYRQGALIDRVALSEWLEGHVGAQKRLGGYALLRFDVPAEATSWAPSNHMVFGHRFAEPFDAMAAQLALAPLPTRRGSSVFSIYALAGLLVLVAIGGLLAVDRMVKVVVSFAERRNRFVASVSHELKTPLTAIRMYAEMLRDGLVRDEAKRDEYYETITDESERLSRLIDNVLEFSKLERGQRKIELAVGAVPDVLEEAASKLRPHVERQGFSLRVAAEPGLPAVRFDRDALLQVLFNLVDNAMKYARPAQPAEVVLEARAGEDRVLVGVRDFGPGVDRRHLARIFEPFYRVEAELTRSAKGTGIGLALVKELGQAMGAAVTGANAEGGGFRVLLSFDPANG